MELRNLIVRCMQEEIVETTGCTDPGVVAYATAKAASLLSGDIEDICVTVSNNVYKNGVMVGIPGAKATGMDLAAALGALLRDHADRVLSVLEGVTPILLERARQMVSSGTVAVRPQETCPDPLYVHAVVRSGPDTAEAIVAHDYDILIRLVKNSEVILSRGIPTDAASPVEELLNHSMVEIYRSIRQTSAEDFAFLLDYATVNCRSLEQARTQLPLQEQFPKDNISYPFPYNAIRQAREDTFCLAKARMVGLKLPVIAVTGSGNHGITSFLGTTVVADTLYASREQRLRALAICIITVAYIKGYIKRMTAFCGCTVAASTGVCAATVYLLGGDYPETERAVNSLLCSLCGILCDGAKETCAFKLSTGVGSAIEYAWLSVKSGFGPPPVNGFLSGTMEKTFAAMGRINNPGMTETDKVLVRIVSENDEANR